MASGMSAPPAISRSSRNVVTPGMASISIHIIRATHLSAVAWLMNTRYGSAGAGSERRLAIGYPFAPYTPAGSKTFSATTRSSPS